MFTRRTHEACIGEFRRMFAAWFRPPDSASWQFIAQTGTQAQAFEMLVNRTRGRVTPASQRFVTNGETPDEFFARLDAVRQERSGSEPTRKSP